MNPKVEAARATWKWRRVQIVLVALLVVSVAVISGKYVKERRGNVDGAPTVTRENPPVATSENLSVSYQNPRAGDRVPDAAGTEASGAKANTSRLPEDISEFDQSVVGLSFQISDSIAEGCRRDHIECPLVMASIKKMAKEPRDIVWAAQTEAKIQAAVETQGTGKYVVRNLECRKSLCILEVEVHIPGAFNEYEKSITSSLRPGAMTISVPEYDPFGAAFHVELMDFERQ